MSNLSPLISAADASALIRQDRVKLLNATWYMPGGAPKRAKEEHSAAHAPGAQFFDIDDIADPDTDLPHMLPSANLFAEKVGALGASEADHIVIYDQNRFMASARAWWMLRIFGMNRVQVVDGGGQALIDAGVRFSEENQTVERVEVTPRFVSELLISADALTDSLSRSDTAVLDARPAARFSGAAPEPRPQLSSGHMPGAVNVPSSALIDETGSMKPPAELAALFPDLPDQIVTSCGSGVTAAIVALALAQLGRFDVAVYDGSWCEWAASGRPIVKD
jgi:thiosulfate/3-mercaptopyruvate sulfurtransferase